MDLAGEQVIRGHFERHLINDRLPVKKQPEENHIWIAPH